MAKIFEPGNFQLGALLSIIQITNHLGAAVKINQVEMKLVSHRIDVTDQILVLLGGPVEITLFINEPRNGSIGS